MNIQTTARKWTKEVEREYMAEAEKDRREAELALPEDRRHADPEWVKSFWRRVRS